MRKNLRGRKATAIALASVMAMSLAACGKQDGSNPGGQTEQKEYVYVPEYLELDDNTNSSYSNMTVQGDKLYYTNYQWDEASGESKVVIGAYSLTDGSREDLPITINADGGGIYSMQADEEGNIYTAEFEWNATEGDDAYTQQTTVLHKYDASGTELMAQDITDIMQQDENNSYVGSMCLDDQGRFYISSDSLIRLFGSDGQFQGAVQTDSQWIQGMGKAKDGKVYLAYYDQSGNVKLSQIDFDGKFVAIKIHFGELGNLSFLRPNYARAVADVVKELGGKPFLTDCNTLYVGSRKNALEHIDTAYQNGFTPYATGCQIIIADGLKGTDEALVPVEGGEYVREAKIGQALMDADIVISLTHFKGHEQAGFGGAMKNLGMGGGSRAGKMEQHNAGKPHVAQKHCIGCGQCRKICAHGAPIIENGKAHIDHDRCVGCGRCIAVCPKDAVRIDWDESTTNLNCKIAEYTKAVVDGRPCFHISLVIDVSPNCDCRPENDMAIVPNVGMFASFDPVALDMACVDAVNAQTPLRGSAADDGEGHVHEHDHFRRIHPDTDWRRCLEHGEKIGIGTREYELIKI